MQHDIAALPGGSSGGSGGSAAGASAGGSHGLQPVAALPAPGTVATGSTPGAAGSPLQGGDTLTLAPEQLDAPATHANIAAQRAPSAALLEESQRHQQLPQTDTAVLLGGQERGAQQPFAAAAAPPPASPTDIHASVLHHVPHSLAAAMHQLPDLLALRPLRQLRAGADPSSSSSSADLSASNALVVSITLRAPPAGGGGSIDTGTALQALTGLVGRQLAVPGARQKLAYWEVASLLRAGTCGDGVCQVGVSHARCGGRRVIACVCTTPM